MPAFSSVASSWLNTRNSRIGTCAGARVAGSDSPARARAGCTPRTQKPFCSRSWRRWASLSETWTSSRISPVRRAEPAAKFHRKPLEVRQLADSACRADYSRLARRASGAARRLVVRHRCMPFRRPSGGGGRRRSRRSRPARPTAARRRRGTPGCRVRGSPCCPGLTRAGTKVLSTRDPDHHHLVGPNCAALIAIFRIASSAVDTWNVSMTSAPSEMVTVCGVSNIDGWPS